MADELDYYKMQLQQQREARQHEAMMLRYGADERELELDLKRFAIEKKEFSIDLLSTLSEMLLSQDERVVERAQLHKDVVKALLEGGSASEKVTADVDKKLDKAGYTPDGQVVGPDAYSPNIKRWMTALTATNRGDQYNLEMLTTGGIFEEAGDRPDVAFAIGDDWSDMPIEHLLLKATGGQYGLFDDEGKALDADKIAAHLQATEAIGKGPGMKEALVQWVEGAQKTRSLREAEVSKLMEVKGLAGTAGSGDTLAAMELASWWMDANMPDVEPFFEDRAAVWAYYNEAISQLGDAATEAGATPKDLINNPDRYSDALGSKRSYVDKIVAAQERLKDDPSFRAWAEDRGKKLADGAKPSFALTRQYARAAARAPQRPRSSGRMVELTVRADEEYDFGATGEGGAPVFALRSDGSYVTPAELDALHTKDLESAPVITAFVADPGSTKAFSAISAAVDPKQRPQFEASIQKILADKTLSPRAQILVDKINSVVQIVNRDGKVMGSWKFPENAEAPGNLQQMFNSFSTQPDVFSVAGSSAAFRKGRGGNQIASLKHDVTGDDVYLEGGIGTYIPNEAGEGGAPGEPLRLTATPPTKKSVVVLDRPGAGQDDDTLYVNQGTGIKTSSIVGLTEVSPERLAAVKGEGADPLEATLFEGFSADDFKAGQRRRQLRRGERRRGRARDGVDWQEPVGVEPQSALGQIKADTPTPQAQELPRLSDIGEGDDDFAYGQSDLSRIAVEPTEPPRQLVG
jgi:hypothetical protein